MNPDCLLIYPLIWTRPSIVTLVGDGACFPASYTHFLGEETSVWWSRHGRTQGAWALCGTHGEKFWVIKRCQGCLRLRTFVAVWFGLVGEYEGMGWTETKGQRNLNHVRSWRMSGSHQVAIIWPHWTGVERPIRTLSQESRSGALN